MKKALLLTFVAVMLTINGCGDSIKVKSVEEYSKFSTQELEKMFDECKAKVDENMRKETGLRSIQDMKSMSDKEKRESFEKALKVKNNLNKITDAIYKARGENVPYLLHGLGEYAMYGSVSDDELSKFGNSLYAERVNCGRMLVAYYKTQGFENSFDAAKKQQMEIDKAMVERFKKTRE